MQTLLKNSQHRYIDENILSPSKSTLSNLDAVITMVPNHKNLLKFYKSRLGPFKNCSEKTLLIDCSTIGPYEAQEVAEEANAKSLNFVDAPVSGGVKGAQLGTLTFMVGAKNQQTFDRAKEFLDPMGKNFFYCGKIGTGQTAKICNNLALAIQMRSIAEAMSLAQSLEMDQKLLSEIMQKSSAR